MILKALLLWAGIIPLAIANGILRDTVLVRWLGPRRARTASGVVLGAVIFGWTWLTIPWLGAPGWRAHAAVGAGWLVLTVAFEFGFGRLVARRSWAELTRAYRFAEGDLWPVVLVVVLGSPLLAAWVRG